MIITIETEEKSYDLQVDEDSSIYNTLQILTEKEMLPFGIKEIPQNIYSMRKKRKISTEASYRECGIHQGDILKIK